MKSLWLEGENFDISPKWALFLAMFVLDRRSSISTFFIHVEETRSHLKVREKPQW